MNVRAERAIDPPHQFIRAVNDQGSPRPLLQGGDFLLDDGRLDLLHIAMMDQIRNVIPRIIEFSLSIC